MHRDLRHRHRQVHHQVHRHLQLLDVHLELRHRLLELSYLVIHCFVFDLLQRVHRQLAVFLLLRQLSQVHRRQILQCQLLAQYRQV